MKITVICKSKAKRGLIESIAQLYIHTLKLENSRYELVISTVTDLAKTANMRGGIIQIGDKILSIALDSKLNGEKLFETLAHEMVHAKQYAKGQLTTYNKRNGEVGFKWMGKTKNYKYFDSPWEIEAYSKEKLLTNKILELLG